MTAHPPTRLGFVGSGGIVQGALAPAAHSARGVVVQAAAARDAARAAAVAGPGGRAYDDYAQLVADPDVDLVYVALDNAGHLPWTLAALAAGKHVICEKPLGLDAQEVAKMRRAAEAADRLLVEAFWYRWHPRTRRLEQVLRQGGLGPVRRVRAVFSFAGPTEGDLATHYRLDPTRGGGALYDVGCYALSLAHLALGAGAHLEVVEAQARWSGSGVDLELSAILEGGGTTVEIGCGTAAPDSQVVIVAGEAATLTFGPPAFTARGLPVDLTITTPDRALRQESFAPVDPYRLMIENVAAATRGEDAYVPGLGHSTQVAATADAIRTVVTAAR